MNACKDCKFYEENRTPLGRLMYCINPSLQVFNRVSGMSTDVNLSKAITDNCDEKGGFTPKLMPVPFWKRLGL